MDSLNELLYKLRKYRWCHNRMYRYYSHRNKFFTIPPIIFASTSSFVILDENDKNYTSFKYISAVLSMLSAMFSGLSIHMGYNAKADCHFMSAHSYDELVTKLDFMINYKETNHTEHNSMIDKLEENILKIKNANKYQLSGWVYEEFENLTKKDVDEDEEEFRRHNCNPYTVPVTPKKTQDRGRSRSRAKSRSFSQSPKRKCKSSCLCNRSSSLSLRRSSNESRDHSRRRNNARDRSLSRQSRISSIGGNFNRGAYNFTQPPPQLNPQEHIVNIPLQNTSTDL